MGCKPCIQCNEVFASDEMTTDAFGDSHSQMCSTCLFELKKGDSRYLLVEVPDIYGKTFVHKQELEHLKQREGAENVKVFT